MSGVSAGGSLRKWAAKTIGPLQANSIAWPVGGIAIMLMLHCVVAVDRAINWDEFWHYTQIHALRDGTLTLPLQTLYTRFFVWVLDLPGLGIDHIIIIRLQMFLCLLVICAGIYQVASRFSDRATALLCVLLYLTAGHVLRHATSFRFDPMAAALLMSSLALMLRSRLGAGAILLTAALAGASLLLTIKSVLYAPAFAGIAWLRWREAEDRATTLVRLAALAVATIGMFAVFYALHSGAMGGSANTNANFTLGNSRDKMFGFGDLPYYPVIPIVAMLAPIFTICLLMVPVVLLRRGLVNLSGNEKTALAGLWLPIVSLAFYHNTAPYYYVFVLAPVAVACSVALPWLVRRYGMAAVSALLVFIAACTWFVDDHSGTLDRQRVLQRTADQIFPERVAYFDHAGMLGRHLKKNAFMTAWGTENYLRGLLPNMRDTMEQVPVPLVLNNDEVFANALIRGADPFLLPADAAALHDNYVQFWGPFWLAGKTVPARAGDLTTEFLVPGTYTVRDGPMIVDGTTYATDDVITIERGIHRLRAASGHDARVIWGDRLHEPLAAPPAEPYWTGF